MWSEDRHLPAGMTARRDVWGNYSFEVKVPADDDGRVPLACPVDRDHVFKASVRAQVLDGAFTDQGMWCPYCGHHSLDVWDFMPEQKKIAVAAAEAWAEQKVHDDLDRMLRSAFGPRTRLQSNGLFSIEVRYESGSRPPVRALPTYVVEETRRTVTCTRCTTTHAVYGISAYCPNCGELDPLQKFAESLSSHRQILAALEDLPREHYKTLQAAGAIDHAHIETVKDGLGSLEAYLKQHYTANTDAAVHPKTPTTFQRLPDVAELYSVNLNRDLVALTGEANWKRLTVYSAIRHVLTHNQGVIDDKFLERVPDWRQGLGRRIVVTSADANELLSILEGLAGALEDHGRTASAIPRS